MYLKNWQADCSYLYCFLNSRVRDVQSNNIAFRACHCYHIITLRDIRPYSWFQDHIETYTKQKKRGGINMQEIIKILKKWLTEPHPGTKALPLGRAPVWWRCKIIGVGRPKSHGVNPCSQQFSQPPRLHHLQTRWHISITMYFELKTNNKTLDTQNHMTSSQKRKHTSISRLFLQFSFKPKWNLKQICNLLVE
jgi:hypothetical protein